MFSNTHRCRQRTEVHIRRPIASPDSRRANGARAPARVVPEERSVRERQTLKSHLMTIFRKAMLMWTAKVLALSRTRTVQ